MAERNKRTLVAQREAIFDYLDALLREIPEEYPEPSPAPPVETAPPAPASEPPPTVAPVVHEHEPAPVVVPEPEPAPVVAPGPAPAPAPELVETEPMVPAWAEPEFQALLFEVEGLKLAVPLLNLHSVVEWSEHITPTPGQPDWCHGLLPYRGRNVRVVDTARLVLPEDKRQNTEPRHMLVVGDGQWALSCTTVSNVIRLSPDEVKWRRGNGQRPWLAGTVLRHLCALLETEAFAHMLSAKERRDRNG